MLFAVPLVACLFVLSAASPLGAAGVLTYLGGSGEEEIHDVAVDGAGDVWVVGETDSADFPGSELGGSVAPNGSRMAFVLRLTYADSGNGFAWTAAERLILGGSRDDRALEVETSGDWIFVAGETDSSDFPASFAAGASPGRESLFLALIDRSQGVAYRGARLIGGVGTETLGDMRALSNATCVALAAATNSPNLDALNAPSAAAPEQAAPAGGTDAFLLAACGDPGGPNITHVTYFGGSADESGGSLAELSDALCLGGSTRSPDLPVSPTAAQPTLTVGLDGYVACFQSTVNSSGGGGFFRVGSTYAGGSGAQVETYLARFPDASDELLVGVLSDSPVRLFDSAAPLQLAGGAPDNPGSNASLAFGGAPRGLDTGTRRFWMGGSGPDRFLSLDSADQCALGLAEIDGAGALIRFCTTDGAGGPRIRHAQTFPLDSPRYGGFAPTGANAAEVLRGEGIAVGGTAVWGVVPPPQPGADVADAEAPQPVFGGGPSDALLRLFVLPYLRPEAVAGAADFQAGAIAPGQMLALFGSGIGADQTLSGSFDGTTGLLSTQVGPSRLWIDEFPAPINFTSRDQLGAVAPFGIDGRVAVTATVERDGDFSNPVTLGVAAAAPGIFTANQSGTGPAAAVNQDFSPNSAASPAGYNTIVSLFLSGCGQTAPAGRDGARAPLGPPFPELTSPVQASIGGLPAAVVYAGAAPGQLEGLCQINLETPLGAAVGDAPLAVSIAGLASQPGVTLSVAQTGGGSGGGGGGGGGLPFSSNPGDIRSCSQLCTGLREVGGVFQILLGLPAASTEKGAACECFALNLPLRDY